MSFYEGLIRYRHPEQTAGGGWNYGILAFAFVFTGVSMVSAYRAFNKQRGDTTFFKAVMESKDPSTFIVLLGDMGDMLGIIIAFLGIYISRRLHNPAYDAIASMAIGGILILISILLVRESKSLLMGESPGKKTIRRVKAITEAEDTVVKVQKQYSIYLAPEEILLQLDVVFKNSLTTEQITDTIERVTQAIQQEYPRIKQIFIEPVAV